VFAELVSEAFDTSGEGDALRILVVKTAVVKVHELAPIASFKSLVRRGGDFVCDYIDELHQEHVFFDR
jgi:hypothetical protein